MRKRTTVVYCAVNRLNGKRYVGVSYDMAQRRLEHFNDARSKCRRPTVFLRAILKYGEQAFEFSVLSIWETRELALAEEIRVIAEQKPEYNMTGGGDGLTIVRNRPVIRLSDGRRYESGRAAARDNDISFMRIAQICRGGGMTKTGELFMYADQPEPPKSIRKTPEQLLESRERNLVGAAKGRAAQSKPVMCINDGREFCSISAAARHYGKHLSCVADAIHRNGRASGLKFQFREAA